MATISDSDRSFCARRWVQEQFVDLALTANMSHSAIKAAVDAADDWADANAAAFNTALPTPFRTTASLGQKTALLAYVILKRANLI